MEAQSGACGGTAPAAHGVVSDSRTNGFSFHCRFLQRAEFNGCRHEPVRPLRLRVGGPPSLSLSLSWGGEFLRRGMRVRGDQGRVWGFHSHATL